ncbi:hypothetical protein M378DRAFT_86870 [Amanita muscaria Koide BX008]|uniref:Uncharacterized protein n=1 Tax=Amanita muscaria (strain Koide BX008) TaxID=946122 RepID=A0A0C2WPI9_AMAMK|nr:hypothetical protein M378DRAFT_86870 [Amanita muscaria Koide BX008]
MISGTQRFDYTFEDRTGRNLDSDWDDIYERLYFRVCPAPTSPDEGQNERNKNKIHIYNVAYRMMRRDHSHVNLDPDVVLEFNGRSLGQITYDTELYRCTFQIGKYIKKTSFFGGSSLIRKFTGSDGNEYKWSHGIVEGQEWTCTTGPNEIIVAHYDLLPAGSIAYRISGHNLVVKNKWAGLSIEFLSTLIIMRHVQQHNL